MVEPLLLRRQQRVRPDAPPDDPGHGRPSVELGPRPIPPFRRAPPAAVPRSPRPAGGPRAPPHLGSGLWNRRDDPAPRGALATSGSGRHRPLPRNAGARRRHTKPGRLARSGHLQLATARARQLDIWETTYLHILDGEDPVLEWVQGTGLRQIVEGLGESERALFLDRYRGGLRQLYPKRPDGRTVFPFHRLFFCASV